MELTGHYTDEGRALLSQSLSAGLCITRVVAASGTTDNFDSATALTGPEQMLTLIPGQNQAPGTTIPAILTASEAARRYDLREVGIFAQSGDGPERILCIYQLDAPVSISPDSRLVLRFLLTLTLSDIPALTVTPSPVGLVTVEELLGERRLWPNKNLLDNWDFRNPVNQRGQSYYTDGYSIDRWCCESNVTCTINTDSITITPGAGYSFLQPIEKAAAYALMGKTLTLSVMLEDGSVYSATGTMPNEFGDYTSICKFQLPSGSFASICFFNNANSYQLCRLEVYGESLTLKAVKVEVGSVSTLANDPSADYGEELRKCQRYQFDPMFGGTHKYGRIGMGFAEGDASAAVINIPTPTTMRTYPVVDFYENLHLVGANGVEMPVTSISVDDNGYQANQLNLRCVASGLAANAPYVLCTGETSGKLLFHCNL